MNCLRSSQSLNVNMFCDAQRMKWININNRDNVFDDVA